MEHSRRDQDHKNFCFRGVRFQIPCEDLPEAVQQSRRFHADLVNELMTQAREHVKLLARRHNGKNGTRRCRGRLVS
jgi:hypothetical protein